MGNNHGKRRNEMKRLCFSVLVTLVVGTLTFVAGGLCFSSPKQVTLRVLSEDIDVDIPGRFPTIGKMFEKQYPNVKVEFVLGEVSDIVTKAKLDMAAGGKPSYDLVYCFIITGDLADNGYIVPLDNTFSSELKEIKSQLTKATSAALEAYPFTYRDSTWGLPFSNLIDLFYYRTDVFEKAGLSRAPKTNEEFLQYCRKLKGVGSGVYPYMADLNDDNLLANWTVQLERFGTRPWNMEYTKTTFNNNAGLETLKLFKTLHDEQLIAPDAITCMSCENKAVLFQSGSAAMEANFPFLYSRLSDPSRSQVVGKWAADIPWGGAGHESVTASIPLGLSAVKAGHQKEAFEFMKYLLSPEIQEYFGKGHDAPLTQAIYDKYRKKSAVLDIYEKAMDHCYFVPVYQREAFTEWKILSANFAPAMEGTISLQSFLDQTSKEIDAVLSKYITN
jgi:ABC-type glycerol-3-phosphate transport system substrate-binding protein